VATATTASGLNLSNFNTRANQSWSVFNGVG